MLQIGTNPLRDDSQKVGQDGIITGGNSSPPLKPSGELCQLTSSESTLEIIETIVITEIDHLVEP